MSKIKAIISDADGTLVNTLYLIRHGQYEATVTYLLRKGVEKRMIPEYKEYESYINKSVGGSTRETFEKTLTLLFSHTNKEILDIINYDEIDDGLAAIQDRIAPIYVNPYNGLTELFSWLGRSKTSFGIFTSGNMHMVVRNFGVSLPVLGFNELFLTSNVSKKEKLNVFIERAKAIFGIPALEIVTCEDVTNTKPDPEGILLLTERLNVKPEEVIVLGDHPSDMKAAVAAGAHAIGISHGFSSPADLLEAGAIKIVGNIGTLPKLIRLHNRGENLIF